MYSTNYGVNWSTPFYNVGGSPSDKNLTGTDDVPSSPYYGRTYTVWSKSIRYLADNGIVYNQQRGSWVNSTTNNPPSSYIARSRCRCRSRGSCLRYLVKTIRCRHLPKTADLPNLLTVE